METIPLKIKELEDKIERTEDFMEKMDLMDELINLKRELGLLKPPNQDIECFGCGS